MKRFLSVFIIAVMVLSVMSSCGEQATEQPAVEDVTFPLSEPVTLTMFTLDDGTDKPFFKELEKRTNVKIEFICPTSQATMASEYTLMVQSGEITDIVRHNWFGYPGGTDKAVSDGVYINLAPYIDRIMPNLKKKLDDNPAARKIMTTPGGNMGYVGWVLDKNVEVRPSYLGPIIRQDFLDSVQKSAPVTMSDWYDTLTAFKKQLNVKNPLIMREALSSTDCFISAYGINSTVMVENGAVKMSLMEESARLYTTEMNKWVREGLMNVNPELAEKDFSSNDNGSWIHGFYMFENWKKAASSPAYRAVGVPYPVLKSGDSIELCGELGGANLMAGSIDSGGYSVAKSCKNPAVAAKWLDYLYSPEGILLASYGVEGDTFTYDADNKPQFTDKVLKYEKGFASAIGDLMYKYSPAWDSWSEVKGYTADEQEAMTKQWKNAKNTKGYPTFSSMQNFMTEEELTVIETPVYLYLIDSVNKMVTGELPLSYWDEMIQQAKVQGSEEQLKVYQSAYDKYQKSIS